MKTAIHPTILAALLLVALAGARLGIAQDAAAAKTVHHDYTVASPGPWQNPKVITSTSVISAFKTHPLLMVSLTVPPDREPTGWLQVKLAIEAEGLERTESPEWLLNGGPGATGISGMVLCWDLSSIAAKLPTNPKWINVELVNQGDRARTLYLDQFRCTTVPKGGTPVRRQLPATRPFLLGAEYPPKPTDSVRDMFYETGMNCIRVMGGGYWAIDEGAAVAREFEARGLGVYLQLGSHYPSGDYFKYKDAWFVDQAGATGVEDRQAWAISYDKQTWPQYSYVNPIYRPQMEADFTRFLGRFADRHNVRGVILHNEPGLFWLDRRLFDYSPMNVAAFRAWLPTQHPDIATLNARWGSNFASFDAVEPPISLPPLTTFGAWMDWRRFQVVGIAGFMKWESDFFAKVRADVPRTTNMPGPLDTWYGYRLSDIAAFSEPMDVVGIDIYPSEWTDRTIIPYSMDMARGTAQGRPVHVLECDVFSSGLWKVYSESERAGLLQGELWTMIGRGARCVLMWSFCGGETNTLTDGTFNDRVRACRDIAHAAEMLHLTNYSEPRPQVAFCVDPDAYIYGSGIEPTPRSLTSELDTQVHGTYAALLDAAIPVDVLQTNQFIANPSISYPAVVLSASVMMDPTSAKRLETFVAEGGTLVAVGSLATMDRWGGRLAAAPGFGLDRVFGVTSKPSSAGSQTLDATTSAGPLQLRGVDERLALNGAETLAKLPDGTPALTVNHFGKGRAILLIGQPGAVYLDPAGTHSLRQLFAEILSPDVTPVFAMTSAKLNPITTSMLTDPRGNVLLVASVLGSRAKLPAPASDVVLTFKNDPAVHAIYAFPGTAVSSNGMICSGPQKLRPIAGDTGTIRVELGELTSALPILLARDSSPLLAITAPAHARSGDKVTLSITCHNPSARPLTGDLKLKLPDAAGLSDESSTHPVSVPAYGEQTIACRLQPDLKAATPATPTTSRRVVLNVTLHSTADNAETNGIPVDLQVDP